MRSREVKMSYNKDTNTSPKIKQLEVNDQEKFIDYVSYIKEEMFELQARVKSLRIAQFIGKYDKYIKAELSEEIEKLGGTTMMVHQEKKLGQVTDRKIHVHNTSDIAYKISMRILRDENISKGIALAALLHDIGQPALGHLGENTASKVSSSKQGGPRPHNATGAVQILHRCSSKIKRAIKNGIAIEMISEEANERNVSIEEISNNIKEGKESNLENEIRIKCEEAKNQIEEAIKTLAMSAGRHNGERGTANIIPNYEITFSDFHKVLENCFVYEGADKEMQSANIIDAIVKISDQISSITYDVIDGKKGGLAIYIPTSYAEPTSKILGTEKEVAIKRFKGNNIELNELVLEIQDKLIESLVRSSSKKKIKLDLESSLYGKKDRKTGETKVQGLRMLTYSEYLPYTSGEEEVKVLQKAWYNCTEKLANEILQPDRMFSRQLNAIFRMEEDDTRRERYEEIVMQQYAGKEEYKDFMKYVLKTTPEEYAFIKQNCHKYGVNLLIEKIEKAKERFKSEKGEYVSNIDDEIEQGIYNYMYSSDKGIPNPENEEGYTDKEIEEIYKDINNIRSMQGKNKLLLQRDERIATQLALGYIETRFNDSGFVNFCLKIGAISEEEAKVLRKPYDPVSNCHYITDSIKKAGKDYAEAEEEELEI